MNMVPECVKQNTEEYERSLRELESKYNQPSAFQINEHAESNVRNHGEQVRSMERKIR
jgi:hypothetical protein